MNNKVNYDKNCYQRSGPAIGKLVSVSATLVFISVFIAPPLGFSAQPDQQASERKVRKELLMAALYCAEPNATSESVRSFSGDLAYKVRFLYAYQTTNRHNKLQIVSYSKNEDRAWLYEMLVNEGTQGQYTLTWLNTAKLRRKGRLWTVSDTLGGIYSYQRVRRLVNRIARTREVRVAYWQDTPANVSCK